MDPLTTVDVTRPWHWGIAILSDPSLGGAIPDVEPNARVSANDSGLVVLVRHAQDTEADVFDDDVPWAEATVTLRTWARAVDPDHERLVVFEGTISTPTRSLWIGDADEETVVPGLTLSTAIRVLLSRDDLDSPSRVWIDAWPA